MASECVGAWGAYVGKEAISGIASQCSCPVWETQRNRYMVHVFQEEKWREREADIFFFFQREKKTNV